MKVSLHVFLISTDFDSFEPGESSSAVETLARAILETMEENEKEIEEENSELLEGMGRT